MSPVRNNNSTDAARLLQLCQQWTAHQTPTAPRPADPRKPAAPQPAAPARPQQPPPPTTRTSAGPARRPPAHQPPYSEELIALRAALAASKAGAAPPTAPPPPAMMVAPADTSPGSPSPTVSPTVSPTNMGLAGRDALPPRGGQPFPPPAEPFSVGPARPKLLPHQPPVQVKRPSYSEELIALRTALAASKAGASTPPAPPPPAIMGAPAAMAFPGSLSPTVCPAVPPTHLNAVGLLPRGGQPQAQRQSAGQPGPKLPPLHRLSYAEELAALRTALAASKATAAAPAVPPPPPAVVLAAPAAIDSSPAGSPAQPPAAARPATPPEVSEEAQFVDLLATQDLDLLLSSFMATPAPPGCRAF
eukprot:EG_transcript_8788